MFFHTFVQFSIFVFALFGFHSYIVAFNLTTQEQLTHKFKKFPISPYSYGSCWKNVTKVVCCTKRENSRISLALYLKSSNDTEYMEHVKAIGGQKVLPTQVEEIPPEIYKPNEEK